MAEIDFYFHVYGTKDAVNVKELSPTDVVERYKGKTNADRIRQMTDEELAEWATTIGRTFGEEYEGYMSCLDWLKKEVGK